MIYFGCHKGAGHYLWFPGMLRAPWGMRPELRLPIDGSYYPRSPELPNGVALLTHEDDRTILGFSDNSVDSRPGSHSTFVEYGTLTFGEMLARAREVFPQVFARFNFEVVPKP